MACEHHEDTHVEHRRSPPEYLRLVQLGGTARPTKLVILPAPRHPSDKDDETDVGKDSQIRSVECGHESTS